MKQSFKYTPDLVDVLLLEFPPLNPTEEGFLDITGEPFKENVISRIYAYYLDKNRNRQLANLFLDSLLELVNERSGKQIKFSSFDCEVERVTKTRKRMDLFIYSEIDQTCLFIENKIYHHLNNDLLDYWNFKDYNPQNKVGVLLTLKPMKVPESVTGKFVNVTHEEWVVKIKSKGLPATLTPREFFYLTDFIRHMEKITEQTQMSSDAKFYFENIVKVSRAIETYDAAFAFVIGQLRIVAEKLNWQLTGSSEYYRHIWDGQSHIYYAIEIGDFFKSNPEMTIIIEMYKEAVAIEGQLRVALEANQAYLNLKKEGRRGSGWVHFAYNTYKLNQEDIINVSSFILEKINREFKPVMDLLIKQGKNLK